MNLETHKNKCVSARARDSEQTDALVATQYHVIISSVLTIGMCACTRVHVNAITIVQTFRKMNHNVNEYSGNNDEI